MVGYTDTPSVDDTMVTGYTQSGMASNVSGRTAPALSTRSPSRGAQHSADHCLSCDKPLQPRPGSGEFAPIVTKGGGYQMSPPSRQQPRRFEAPPQPEGFDRTGRKNMVEGADGRLYRSERRKRGGAPARPAQQRAEFPPIRTSTPGSPGPW